MKKLGNFNLGSLSYFIGWLILSIFFMALLGIVDGILSFIHMEKPPRLQWETLTAGMLGFFGGALALMGVYFTLKQNQNLISDSKKVIEQNEIIISQNEQNLSNVRAKMEQDQKDLSFARVSEMYQYIGKLNINLHMKHVVSIDILKGIEEVNKSENLDDVLSEYAIELSSHLDDFFTSQLIE